MNRGYTGSKGNQRSQFADLRKMAPDSIYIMHGNTNSCVLKENKQSNYFSSPSQKKSHCGAWNQFWVPKNELSTLPGNCRICGFLYCFGFLWMRSQRMYWTACWISGLRLAVCLVTKCVSPFTAAVFHLSVCECEHCPLVGERECWSCLDGQHNVAL